MSKIFDGVLKKTEKGWGVVHREIDPYAQIPNPIPLHPTHYEDSEGDVKFEIVLEEKYYAKIIKIVEMIDVKSEKTLLKSLEQHNAEKMKTIVSWFGYKEKNGIACPDCGEELYDSDPMLTLTSFPAKKNIHCDNCHYLGYRIA